MAAQTSDARRTALSFNPLGIPFEWISVEVETRIASAFSLGFGANHFGPDEFSITSFEGKLRLYPNENPPGGFSVGLSAGWARFETDNACNDLGVCEDEGSGATIGATVDYHWLLGRNKRFFVALGSGAKRFVNNNCDDVEDVPCAYPTARFQIGYVF